MRRLIALISLSLLSLSLFAAESRIGVPHVGSPPKVDGTILPLEWRGAARVPLADNMGHAMLMHDGNFLYVALVGAKPGIGSVCARGRTGVRVLHASAALGTAAFEPEKGKWRMTRGFTWSNRDTGSSPEATADRQKFLSTDGWFANTSHAAAPQREYQIPIRGQREVPIVLGFLSFTPEEQKFYYWPSDLEDDCADPGLASGFTDREFKFDPSKWGVLELQ
ncbi:MAG TPA: hypothetical protein VEK79_04990 [Thermoanaerobaculia bacterium]|nr:hypothetical protein [Thermoanaerobaculia bacterium]